MADTPHNVREEELAALADGSLDAARRDVVLRAVEADPALADALVAQRRVLDALALAQRHVQAPHDLRVAIATPKPQRAPARRGLRAWLAVGAATVVVAAGALVVLQRSSTAGPTLNDTASAAGRFSTEDPPQPGQPKLLNIAVEGVAFPNYEEKFGWKAVGQSRATVGGREVVTVTYQKGTQRVGYAIVPGEALDVPAEAERRESDGSTVQVVSLDGTPAVTWQRKGHTCLMVGPGVPVDTLVELAGWKGKGAVDFAWRAAVLRG